MSASKTGRSSTLLYKTEDIEILVSYNSDWSPSSSPSFFSSDIESGNQWDKSTSFRLLYHLLLRH